MEPNINNHIEEDQNEDDLWYDGDYDDTEDMTREEEENYDRATSCTCGAWVMTEKGNVFHVADCYCGAE